MADEQRTFQFQGRAAHTAYARLRRKNLPLADPWVLSKSNALDKWAGRAWWQRQPHSCVCTDGASGRCPRSQVFIQGFRQGGGVNLRIFAPDLLVLIRVTVTRPRRGNQKPRIKTLYLEWRVGKMPEFLSRNGKSVSAVEIEKAFATLLDLLMKCRLEGFACEPLKHVPRHGLTAEQENLVANAVSMIRVWQQAAPSLRKASRVVAMLEKELARKLASR